MKNELLFFITPRVITPSMVNKMQDHSYMSYKKNLEYHKENLTQKLNEADDTGVEEEKAEAKKEEKPKKEEKAEKELTPLEMLAGKGEEEF
jgi:type II secretory pathway component GspD/PulD (secretin)